MAEEIEIELQWMPVYWERLLGGTTHMDAAELGGYILLIAEQWKKGFLPTDEKKLMKIARQRSKDKLHTILEKFKADGAGNLINKVCAEIRIEQLAKYAKSSASGKKGAEKRWRKDGHPISDPISDPNGDPNGDPTFSAIAEERNKKLEDTKVSIQQQQHAHKVFSKKLFSDIGTLDRKNIELQLNPRRLITEEDCEAFNRHLQTEGKHHVHWSEYIKHLRNWLNTRPSNNQKTGNSFQNSGKLNAKMTAEDLLTINQLAKDGISEDN